MTQRIAIPTTTPDGILILKGFTDGYRLWFLLSAPHAYRARRNAKAGKPAQAILWAALYLLSWAISPAAGLCGVLRLAAPHCTHFATKDAVIGFTARGGGNWFIDDHTSARPGTGQGGRLRDLLFAHRQKDGQKLDVKITWKYLPKVTKLYQAHHKTLNFTLRHGWFFDHCLLEL